MRTVIMGRQTAQPSSTRNAPWRFGPDAGKQLENGFIHRPPISCVDSAQLAAKSPITLVRLNGLPAQLTPFESEGVVQ